ncbi:hypothetical protein E1218_02770 [Kribbella turkmenica]|uniref:Uncharacterized protein n=1 Tax=Kribbella turkmenica TaxID=2530375 RepID=A0A4R4XGM5_9ACTN|nr:hypothetical protein [Kribbella turkmenica]TDD29884.1 hypothetical protein E1218_02770 [Kribbella turkmenica]
MALVQGIPGEFGPQPWGDAILRNCESLLLRITRRPADHEVRLPGLATTPRHVVEDRTGRALTWRRDGDDLLVRLPDSAEAPVVRVTLKGKLRIVPPDTVTANADGVWDLTATGTTSHLVARRAADVAVRVFTESTAGRATACVALAGQTYAEADADRTIGPFQVPARLVVPLRVEATGVRRVLVAPIGTVLASIHPTSGGALSVVVTNFGRTPARGDARLRLPDGSRCKWSFAGLEPGDSTTWPVRIGGPAGRHEVRVRLDAGRRSASSPYSVCLPAGSGDVP